MKIRAIMGERMKTDDHLGFRAHGYSALHKLTDRIKDKADVTVGAYILNGKVIACDVPHIKEIYEGADDAIADMESIIEAMDAAPVPVDNEWPIWAEEENIAECYGDLEALPTMYFNDDGKPIVGEPVDDEEVEEPVASMAESVHTDTVEQEDTTEAAQTGIGDVHTPVKQELTFIKVVTV